MRLSLISILLAVFFLQSCGGSKDSLQINEPGPGCEYASNFGIINDNEESEIFIKSFELNSYKEKDNWIPIPSNTDYKKIVCMSTSHISYIEALGEAHRIVGVSGAKYISSEYIINGISNGSVADVGFEGSLNYELLISLQPDLVLTYGIEGENNQYIERIKQFNIPVIALGDYLENHPLGKLEYIKLFGKLLGKEELSDSLYEITKRRYQELRLIAKDAIKRKVLINAPWKDVWYIPSKQSYMNILVEDAGGEILGSSESSSYTKAFSIEEVFILSSEAEVWLNPNAISTIKELSSLNPLFSKILPIISNNVYNNTKLNTPGGGSQFWEKGVMEPDIILTDLIHILHPELAPNHNLSYYINLK